MFYRAFSRKKSISSIEHKFSIKNYHQTHKMQDLYGVRIALYFKDDVSVCSELIKQSFKVVDVSKDKLDPQSFKPIRLNFVCELPKSIKEQINLDSLAKMCIDETFEVQIRTIFSEGWHEIEHDLRYKCIQDWDGEDEMKRALNGIFATLETCDWSIISMFDQLAYKKYKSREWSSMLRNKMRLRLADDTISGELNQIITSDPSIAKELLKVNRSQLIRILSNSLLGRFPRKMDTIIYISNEFFIHNKTIEEKMPEMLLELCTKLKENGITGTD